MAVIATATLVVLGITALVGTGGAIWHACTEEDRSKEKIKQLQAENEQLNLAKNYVNELKSKFTSAKEYLTNAKKDFKNGGHVLDGLPLANLEFTSCINKLDGAIGNANNLINDFEHTISQNNKDIGTEQAKLK